MKKADVLRLVEWCKEKEIRIILDESFADFADEEDNSLIHKEILLKYPNLYVMKSISKSYGVPGLRLGVLASGDAETIGKMKSDVAIWNINSFAEFYMQIYEKYKSSYAKGLVLFREERERFSEELGKIPGVRVIPSQANYVILEITSSLSAYEVTRLLLCEHNIIVKDLTGKIGPRYIRVAVRDEADDNMLISALRNVL